MPKLIDMTGQRYERLTVVCQNGKDNAGHPLWKCRCDCGNVVYATGNRLRSGNTRSCGCLHKEQLSERNTKHGNSKTRLYSIYKGIKDRCYRKKNTCYKLYGGRGITVCDEWLGENGFNTFQAWAIENGYADDLTIDRIDCNKGYSPDNCRWATNVEQANNKRSNRRIKKNGESHTIAEWSKITGLSERTIEARLRVLNWDAEKALSVAVGENYG